MNKTPQAVVIGGHANGLGVATSLGRAGIPVHVLTTLRSDMAHKSRFVRSHDRAPEITERAEALVGYLQAKRDRHAGSVLVPTNDYALSAIAKAHDLLSTDYLLTTPDWPTVERVLDKSITQAHAREVGIAVPEVYGKATQQFSGARDLTYPVLVKPVQGHRFAQHFQRKLFLVATPAQLADVIARVEDAGFDCDILQFIAGPDSATRHFQVYIDHEGQAHGTFTYRKLRQEPPMFGVARACETCRDTDLAEPSLALLSSIGWQGIASVAYKTDTCSGQHYIMEINGRSPLSQGLARRAGFDYPLMAYSDAVDGQVTRGDTPNGWEGVWIHLHADFFSTLKSLGTEHFTWGEFLYSYWRPKTFAVWAWDDPMPLVHEWWHSFKKTPSWLMARLRALGEKARRVIAFGEPASAGGTDRPARGPS